MSSHLSPVDYSSGVQDTLEVFHRVKNYNKLVVRIYNQFSPSTPING